MVKEFKEIALREKWKPILKKTLIPKSDIKRFKKDIEYLDSFK